MKGSSWLPASFHSSRISCTSPSSNTSLKLYGTPATYLPATFAFATWEENSPFKMMDLCLLTFWFLHIVVSPSCFIIFTGVLPSKALFRGFFFYFSASILVACLAPGADVCFRKETSLNCARFVLQGTAQTDQFWFREKQGMVVSLKLGWLGTRCKQGGASQINHIREKKSRNWTEKGDKSKG